MDFPLFRPLVLTLCLALGPVLRADPAATPAKDAAKPADGAKPAAPAPADQVLILPKIEISQSRIKAIDKEIHKLDKLIVREEARVKSTELDQALNNAELARAAAIFGGNSAEHLSAVAAGRLALLETERGVLEDMKRPATLDDLAKLKAELEELRTTRRNLDDAAKQR